MTPQEATDRLFEAAKSGDIAALRTALDAGANLEIQDNKNRSSIDWARINGQTEAARFLERAAAEKARKKDDSFAGVAQCIIVGMFGAIIMGAMFLNGLKNPAPGHKSFPKNSNFVSKEEMEAVQKQLRSALKDPAMTDWLIEQVKDPSVIQKFMTDPEIMKNFRKVATAIEGDVKDNPGNWTDKARQSKSDQSLMRD